MLKKIQPAGSPCKDRGSTIRITICGAFNRKQKVPPIRPHTRL